MGSVRRGAIILPVSMNSFDFAGRTAIVTGGMQGIGAAIAEAAEGIRRESGDLGSRRLAGRRRRRSQLPCEQAMERTVRELGKIDVLVNNAGIAGKNVPTVGLPDRGMGARAAHQPDEPVPVLPRRRAAHGEGAATAASSTSPPSPARKATRTPSRTRHPRRASSRSPRGSARSWRRPACW